LFVAWREYQSAERDTGRVDPQTAGETEQAYFESLVAQWNTLSERTRKIKL
jgi:hypothetical protein